MNPSNISPLNCGPAEQYDRPIAWFETCTIVPETFADGYVGTLNTWSFSTTGCRTAEKPVRFNVVSGQIPPGLTLFTQCVRSGGITGISTTRGTFSFVVRATDTRGAFAERTFSITVT